MPFERTSYGLESVDYRDEEEMVFNESTVKEDDYGQELPSKALSHIQNEATEEIACSWMQYLSSGDIEEHKTPVWVKLAFAP